MPTTTTTTTTTTTSSPTRLTTTGFRKIELQSPADLAYLVARTQRAARQKIDVAFPPSAAPTDGEDDGMRRRVEELVSRFVERTWEGVRANVCCNGVDMDGGDAGKEGGVGEAEEFETLDAKLAEKIRVLEAEKERLTVKVTGLRREAPAKAAEGFRKRWVGEEEAFVSRIGEKRKRDVEVRDQAVLDAGEFKRWEDVNGSYEKGTDGLVKLKAELTETVARLERAKGVVEYMGSKTS